MLNLAEKAGLGVGAVVVVQLIVAIIKLFAIIAGMQAVFDIPWFFAAIVWFFTAPIPFLGAVLSIIGAVKGWGWNWFLAILVFGLLEIFSLLFGGGLAVALWKTRK